MKTLSVCFNVILSDGFEKAVREFFGYNEETELSTEDIREFLEYNMDPATSNDPSFEVEGGNTDGWFIQSYT